MALRFLNLDRPSIRRLKPGERITEHGITATTVKKAVRQAVVKAGDDVLNASEAQSPLSISGTATGAVGQTVTVALNGAHYTATVAAKTAATSSAATTRTCPSTVRTRA